jgi:peptide/nickel transport system substrate-binding protein
VKLTAGLAAALALCAATSGAMAAPKTIRAVMQADLGILDPVVTTGTITADHGAMIYDTLFGIDTDLKPQPQMVGRTVVSDDKLTWTFTLRDGLLWHDGGPVTAKDCVASIRRWAQRDGAGARLMSKTAALEVIDDHSFRLVLKEPFGMVTDILAKTSTPVPYMMRERDAMTDANTAIKEVIGSGPFRFVASERMAGSQTVYERNPAYVPRSEPPSGFAGGKIVKVDRVVWTVIPDAQTAVAALLRNEIDFYETPPSDLLPMLKKSRDVKLQVLDRLGNQVLLRMNHLQPPFDNVKARQAMLLLTRQEDYMGAVVGDPDYYRICGALLVCGSPMENDAHTEWLTHHDVERAKQLFKEAGYDGRKVVVLQPADYLAYSNAAQVTVGLLQEAGVNAELATSDWSTMLARRSNRGPVDKGGWNIFHTGTAGNGAANPILNTWLTSTGASANVGWPTDARNEELRDQWATADTLEERKRIGRQIQQNAYEFVPYIPVGITLVPVAYRTSLSGFVPVSGIVAFWGVDKAE